VDWLKTTAQLHDEGLLADDNAGNGADAGQAPPSVDIQQIQFASARQRLRTLAFWRQAAGGTVQLAQLDGPSVSATLRTCDGKQDQLFVHDLLTQIGTYPRAVVNASDLTHVVLGGEWELRRGAEVAGSDAHDAMHLGAAGGGLLQLANPTSSMASDKEAAGKYWPQRESLFSKYAQGVKLDAEGWFSVTPERVAQHIAERCLCDLVLDPFVGVGGNAIQFAFTCERVLAIDLDLPRLLLAQHNARVYGVADRIEFVHGDFTALAPRLRADVIFLSPPWGGPDYQAATEFDARTMMGGLDGFELLRLAFAISPHVAYYLPRNTARSQLAEMAGMQEPEYEGAFETERCVLNGRLKALVAYFGELSGGAAETAEEDAAPPIEEP